MAGKRTTRHDPVSHLRAASARWGGTLYKSAPTKSISVEDTFEQDVLLAETEPTIRRLAEKLWSASRKESRAARTARCCR